MSEAPSEPARPGCLLCLLQTSASMYQHAGDEGKQDTKLTYARYALDLVLDAIAKLDHPQVRGLYVGAIGYSARPGEAPVFTSLLPGADREPYLVPLKELAAQGLPRWPNDARSWIDVQKTDGAGALAGERAPAGQALAYAYHLVQMWLGRHPDAWPLLVVHSGDEEGFDAAHALVSESLPLLHALAGPVHLAHVACTGARPEPIFGKQPDASEGQRWQDLWQRSCPVGSKDGRPYRALAINTNPWPLLKHLLLSPPEGKVPWPAPEGVENTSSENVPATLWQDRALCYVKKGNAENEWEDAWGSAPGRLVAAVSDGASEGIFAKAWSHLLAESFVAAVPDLGDSAARTAWIEKLRTIWAEIINVQSLRWSQQNKVNQTGAAATLLTLQVQPGAGPEAPWRWRSWAVGDSCLFCVRDNRLRAAFPVVAAAHFAMGPPLLRTNGDASLPAPVCAEGECRPGDLFVLATDAVAQWMLQQVEEGGAPDWGALTKLDEEAWRRQIDAAREEQRIANDDCTLLVVRVGGASGGSADRLQGR